MDAFKKNDIRGDNLEENGFFLNILWITDLSYLFYSFVVLLKNSNFSSHELFDFTIEKNFKSTVDSVIDL